MHGAKQQIARRITLQAKAAGYAWMTARRTVNTHDGGVYVGTVQVEQVGHGRPAPLHD